jgi:hypothetical protein
LLDHEARQGQHVVQVGRAAVVVMVEATSRTKVKTRSRDAPLTATQYDRNAPIAANP